MKKIYFILSIAVSNFCVAQNEWNSINNSTSPMFRNGNVAIGTGVTTTLPLAVLGPSGQGTKLAFGNTNIVANYGTNASALEIMSQSQSEGSYLTLYAGGATDHSSFTFGVTQYGANFYSGKAGTGIARPMLFYTHNGSGLSERLKINTDGTVGIGIPPSYPSGYRLYVTDGILTEKVKVAIKTTANWSDFVFAKDYKLKTLDEVEAFITLNKHLPGVPSADEVVKEGIDMATMDAKLLEKIEELTLYMIELKKEVESLKKANIELKANKQ
jgi:hypothetical protein